MLRLIAFALAACVGASASAYETDPYQNRAVATTDARIVLNREVNATIVDLVAHWRGPVTESRMVDAIYHRIGGRHWVDRLERWAMRSREVEKLPTPRYGSVYSDLSVIAVRVGRLFGIGPSFRVAGVLIGSDKIGHFLSQGRKFWRRYQRSGDEAQAARHSAYTERAIFGSMTTGVYSNADLVANYEGHRFYRSLFEDDIVPGKPALLARTDSGWQVQREFDFADYVNPWWDEALYPNAFDSLLAPPMRARLLLLCGEARRTPELWQVAPDIDAALAQRYAMLELRDRRNWRMPALCDGAAKP